MAPKQFVAYYRVSTKAQGNSGLGLEAQRAAVASYVDAVGGEVVSAFEDVESGRSSDRSGLTQALQRCNQNRATLVIAKLDRLSRNVSFISKLLDSGVEFIAADMPSANRLTIHIVAAIAEYEREQISCRVTEALRAAIARGVKVGNPSPDRAQSLAIIAVRNAADMFALKMAPIIARLESRGPLPLRTLASLLQHFGHPTARGKAAWTASGVSMLKRRLAAMTAHG